jgi:esterase/lipase superfamily enzyme
MGAPGFTDEPSNNAVVESSPPRERIPARLRSAGSSAAHALAWAPPWILGLFVYAVFVGAGRASAERASLEVMGFDPDRAELILALTLAAACAAAACLPKGQRLVPSLIGLLAGAASFGPVFVRETQVALEPVPPNGPFDPWGWVLTVVALLSTGLATGWAAAVLCGEIRTPVRRLWSIAANAAHGHGIDPGDAAPPAAVLVVAALFLCSVPTLSDLLTSLPDVRMSTGGAPGVYFQPGPEAGLVSRVTLQPSESPGGSATPGSSPDISPSVGPSETTATPSESPSTTANAPSPSPSPQATPPATRPPGLLFAPGPWLAWRPSGAGRTDSIEHPAPWTGGVRDSASVLVYLPPGYDVGTRRYPVFYQAPWGYGVWNDSYHISAVLDSLIDSGRIPASIVVFATEWGGPYSPSECADSADGREWFDRYMAETVVPDIDRRYRTIAKPAARVAWGFSDGAHCAATLALRHPDVFGQAILISGMYSTDQAYVPASDLLPFGNDPAVLAAYTPIVAARAVPREHRSGLYFIVAGDPADPAFGPTMTSFVNVLNDSGYPCMELRVGVIHGWDQIRKVFPTTFQEAAARMTAEGVFEGAQGQ